jgi:glycosyltransferase involved in cell wall biosynthesis
MRVGFDLSWRDAPGTASLARIADGLLPALRRRARIEPIALELPRGAARARWRQLGLPREARRLQLAGVHSFTSSFALLAPGKRVQTVHELPWRHGVAENAGLRHRAWAAFGPWRAHALVCGSETIARELERARWPFGARARAIPWGVGPPFAVESADGLPDEPVLARWRLGEDPLLLCLGAVRAKKNLAALLHGVAALRARGGPRVQIVVSGEHSAQLRRDLGLAQRLGLSGCISTPGLLPEADLPALLRLASAVPVLSRSEGFSLSALEALACGTPVLVPHGSAQAEVAGELAILVDPLQPDSVADGLERALAQREELRYALAERAARYSWERCAQRVEDLWASLV